MTTEVRSSRALAAYLYPEEEEGMFHYCTHAGNGVSGPGDGVSLPGHSVERPFAGGVSFTMTHADTPVMNHHLEQAGFHALLVN